MKLTFLGTRGYIEARSRRHRRHASLLVGYHGARLMIDCGEDWLGSFQSLRPDAILLTHAHPDHAGGLARGAPCPVYATEEGWKSMEARPIREQRVIANRRPAKIAGLTVEAFSVEHSTRAPAVGYRLSAGRAVVFYAPDLVYIHERAEALAGARLYIGDGASIGRSLVRRRQGRLIGHAPVRTQLTWCRKEGVPGAIITHCGSEIVEGDERRLGAELRGMAKERGVEVQIAFDGMERVLR